MRDFPIILFLIGFILIIVGGVAIYFSATAKPVLKTGVPSLVAQTKVQSGPAVPAAAPATSTPEKIAKTVEPAAVVAKPAQKLQDDDSVDESSSVVAERFVVLPDANAIDQVLGDLADEGFIADKLAAGRAFNTTTIPPGGYKLSKGMSLSQIARVLTQKPYMKWVVIPEGLRKEEIAVILGTALGWTKDQEAKWISTDTKMKYDNVEGVYFPDTYLVPVDELLLDVVNRLVAKFNEKFAVYLPEFNEQNIKWTTGLTLASIVQREAASDPEMPLVAGILWNRLEQGMPLDVDATLQYVRGDVGKGWWAPITVADKQTQSPYNTYLNKGLPPHPICNPGIPAIEAVLNPAQTDCLYYLHGNDGQLHCAKTYEEHQQNIEQYLKQQ
jgi:UPF0755 protein